MPPDKLEMGATLPLHRCPHCQIAKPLLSFCELNYEAANDIRMWAAYVCSHCKNVVTARGHLETVSGRPGQGNKTAIADEVFPDAKAVEQELPETARKYLEQAHRSLGDAPDAAAMVAASSVDAMLKGKGYNEPKLSLHDRINQAVAAHLLTKEMGEWAHKVRLDSNNPRHADNDNPHVSPEQAKVVVEFAEALGHFLYVLPSRVAKGIGDAARADD